ncbi:hypothetical protein H4582DRAFT_2059951 [Lactarius indigo]|nr:hypothetical protein H4582DRAFT_2059951 [Lactarius indigo]
MTQDTLGKLVTAGDIAAYNYMLLWGYATEKDPTSRVRCCGDPPHGIRRCSVAEQCQRRFVEQLETVGFGRREAVLPVVQAFAGIATSHRESPRSGTRRTTIVKGARECGALEKARKVTAELVTSYSGRPIRGKRRSKVPKGARGCGTRESAASEEKLGPSEL